MDVDSLQMFRCESDLVVTIILREGSVCVIVGCRQRLRLQDQFDELLLMQACG
jgi:hypothetical protein